MKRTLHLLLIEDSAADGQLLVEMLRSGHYEPVVQRVDTAEALQAALRQKPWDLVISDYSLPVLSGLEALRLVQESGVDMPFVLVSGVVDEEQAIEAIRAGAYDFLRKDRLRRLEAVVERALREAQVRRARRQAESALRESEERYRALAESAPDFIYITNREGDLRYVNTSAARAFRHAPEQLIGMRQTDLFPPEVAARHSRNIQGVFDHGAVVVTEERVQLPVGDAWIETRLVPLRNAHGETMAVLGISRNVTERKQAEVVLKASEDRFRAIFDQTTRLAVLLKPDGTILEANHAFLAFGGRRQEEVIGQPLWEAWSGLFHVDARQRLKQSIDTAARAGLAEQEEWVHNAGGEEVALDYVVRSLLNPRGVVNLLVFEARDISEHRHLEQEMLKVSQRERQRLGQDLHDTLGQNLVGLAFLSKLLSRQLTEASLPGVHEAQEIEKLANLTSAQAHALANGLCPVDPTADGLMHALQDLGTNTSRLFGMDCFFHCDQSVLIHSDFTALHLYYIAREAVTNAIEHGHAKTIRIRLRQRDGHLMLTIVADGTPFAQKSEEHRGMGLRTMVYRARVVGGALDIASQPAGGTIVTCSLPITARETTR